MKRTLWIGGLAVLGIVLVGGAGFALRGIVGGNNAYVLVPVERGDLEQSVFVTGTVEPANEVELGFDQSGRVSSLRVAVGDEVRAGQRLATLSQSQLVAQLQEALGGVDAAIADLEQAQANLTREEILLDKQRTGNREEEIRIAQRDVLNARAVLTQAESSVAITEEQSDANIAANYQAAHSAMTDAADDTKNALIELTDIQDTYFAANNTDAKRIENDKAAAIFLLFSRSNGGSMSKLAVSGLSGGLYDRVLATQTDNTDPGDDLTQMIQAVESTFSAFDNIGIDSTFASADITTISTQKSLLTTALSNLRDASSDITTQLATNNANVASAEQTLITAQNTLASAEEELQLLEAGSRIEDISSQEAVVASAEATVRAREAAVRQQEARASRIRAELGETTITAPFSGIVTEVDTSIGESALSGTPVITLIAAGGNEVEAFVPEINIGLVAEGQEARMEFESFPDQELFGSVSNIDPAETIDDGLASYGITIQFTEEDERIRPGMTADIRLIVEAQKDVLSLPLYAIQRLGEATGVYTLDERGRRVFVPVELGLQGDNGRIEVDGINEETLVVTDP